ncbi:MAG TPA: amino acid adenylation domain-containing protein, partial [Longimicrobium sp.]|nr:amino acid adenylation domain-containing protein [Longimicrobium sp.]
LAEIWAEVLRVERVGRWDNFFELGGHSLLAVRVISRVRQVLGVEVALGELFTRPVLGDFARELEKAARSELPPIEPAGREGRLPLSFAQQRLWFLEQLGGLGSTYHLSTRLRLRGELNRTALVRALDGIVARHEALRTTFAQVDGDAEQRIAPADAGFRLREHDLGGEADAAAEFGRLLLEEGSAPFNLERGPLIRGRLIRLAADDHVLLITMHHIVSDGWSMGVLFGELSALYAAHREGREPALPGLPVQYADYAVWQRRWMEGDVLRGQAEWWKETLAGAPELLELPTDRPRPAQVDHAGALLGVELDKELAAELKALSRRHGTTLFMTLLAAWAVVLSRLSGQDELVTGTPSAGRGRAEIEGLIGFFVNTLALRLELSGSPTVAELLRRVKERALAAQHHQDIPFEQVVELLDPARSLSHHPLFQVMFAWQNAPRGDLRLPGLEVGSVRAGSSHAQAKFDLSLSLWEAGDRIVGSVTYATALFEGKTVERWIGYLRRVLEEMVAGESRHVERLALMPESERARVVEEWNGTEAEYPADMCVHELFEQQVARTPGAEALVFDGERLTYAELNARANRLAHHLRSLGVGPDVRVGICVERSPEMVVGMLAVLKAGGAYVPLDPGYPAERLAYMLADSAPAAVLTQKRLRDRVASAGVPVLELDVAAPPWSGRPDTNPAPGALTPGHLAYLTYTSGSTGRPKGVMNPHRGSVNRLAWLQERHGLGVGEGVLQNSSFSFDASVFEISWPLTVGGRVVLPRPEGHRDPEYLIGLISGERVSTAYFVCSMLQLFLEYPGADRCTTLARLLCGGEPLSPSLVQHVRERLPWARLHNLYGPTESAVSATGPVTAEDDALGTVPIGRPAPNVRIYLLDEWGEPAPVRVAGEMYVGGAQLARGYLDRPGLTAERFVPDPFGGRPGARLYRTGDRARWRADGRIEFLGRMDFQVKVRGFRVEPGEVEERLKEHAGVRDAAVLAREDTPGDMRLVAYWLGEPVEAEALRAHLGEMLPAYMVPSAFVRLEQWPLTPTGKLDRKALPAPEGSAYASAGYEAPASETEEALAAIWSELLGVERVGRHDNFFDLGGHSLRAIRLVLRVKEELQVDLALRVVFELPVLSSLAEHLLDAQLARFDPEELAHLARAMSGYSEG